MTETTFKAELLPEKAFGRTDRGTLTIRGDGFTFRGKRASIEALAVTSVRIEGQLGAVGARTPPRVRVEYTDASGSGVAHFMTGGLLANDRAVEELGAALTGLIPARSDGIRSGPAATVHTFPFVRWISDEATFAFEDEGRIRARGQVFGEADVGSLSVFPGGAEFHGRETTFEIPHLGNVSEIDSVKPTWTRVPSAVRVETTAGPQFFAEGAEVRRADLRTRMAAALRGQPVPPEHVPVHPKHPATLYAGVEIGDEARAIADRIAGVTYVGAVDRQRAEAALARHFTLLGIAPLPVTWIEEASWARTCEAGFAVEWDSHPKGARDPGLYRALPSHGRADAEARKAIPLRRAGAVWPAGDAAVWHGGGRQDEEPFGRVTYGAGIVYPPPEHVAMAADDSARAVREDDRGRLIRLNADAESVRRQAERALVEVDAAEAARWAAIRWAARAIGIESPAIDLMVELGLCYVEALEAGLWLHWFTDLGLIGVPRKLALA